MAKPAKNTICLWYDRNAEDAARFYAKTFPDSSVGEVHRAPGDFPSGKRGDVLTVEFTVMGIPCLGLNGGPAFKHNEAFSFQVATADQAETDRYWNAIVANGGQESACGWGKDKWGLSWQITPGALTKRSEEHTSELQSPCNLVCRLLLEKKKKHNYTRGLRYGACLTQFERGTGSAVLFSPSLGCSLDICTIAHVAHECCESHTVDIRST